MILRRIIESLKSQDIGTLIAEVLVVVVGIFIGLQVDDWNESRQDKSDEQAFMARLHADIILAENISSRVRERRLSRLEFLMDASDVLFGRAERDTFGVRECRVVGASHFFNINISDLSALVELMASGRLAIIRNAELRSALVELQQRKNALRALIGSQSATALDLPLAHPDLIKLTSYFDTDLGESQSRYECDVAGMRLNQAFLNGISENIDIYDAYIRDGLAPWSSQFDLVHQLVDGSLDINHEAQDG